MKKAAYYSLLPALTTLLYICLGASLAQAQGFEYTIASQPDESYFCPDWRDCFTGGASHADILLGSGAGLAAGSLYSVTIAKDPTSPFVANPWFVDIVCYTNASYTTLCSDWVQPNASNSAQPYFIRSTTVNSFR